MKENMEMIIDELNDFFISISKQQRGDVFYKVCVVNAPEGWVYPNENSKEKQEKSISYQFGTNSNKGCLFIICEDKACSFYDILKAAKSFVTENKEREKKENLVAKKIEELKEFISGCSLEEAEKISFESPASAKEVTENKANKKK